MHLIYGQYHFARRKVGAQNDFCNACERECLSELWRSFDCFHIYWIPLLPLGRHERWLCALCKRDPKGCYKTRKGFKIAGLIALAFILVVMFASPIDPKEKDTFWGIRIGAALGFLGLLYSVLKRPPAISDEERRRGVVPLSAETCVYCGGQLTSEPCLHCRACQIRIYPDRTAPPRAPSYPESNIEAVLSYGDPEDAMSGFLACMEDQSLWQNPVARRVGCLGIVYWRSACEGIGSVIGENGPGVVREAMALFQELGAERTLKAWDDIFALFPGGAPPDEYPEYESAMELVREEQGERLHQLAKAFEKAFYEDEEVLTRLHDYISRHKDQFPGRTKIGKV